MPLPPSPVRYHCGQCQHRWTWAPHSDVLLACPGTCPRCGSTQTSGTPYSPTLWDRLLAAVTGQRLP